MILKRVGPLSTGKIMGILYTAIGFFVGAIFAIASILGSAFGRGSQSSFLTPIFGVGAIIAFPIFYGLLGFVVGIVMAAIYNVAAKAVGGVEMDLE